MTPVSSKQSRLAAADQAVGALRRLVAGLETNSEAGAPDYAHNALAAVDGTAGQG